VRDEVASSVAEMAKPGSDIGVGDVIGARVSLEACGVHTR
jgi:hypothetical protein